jgi:two-component system sensor histidine kinase KdpD
MSEQKSDWKVVARWTFWIGLFALTTVILLAARAQIDQSHVALTLLLVVLGGSAGGGRTLGFVLAIAGFVVIDYFFQPPYDLLSVDKPLDWVVLVAFLASAFVATELFMRARDEAKVAKRRADEVAAIARVGAETLRYAEPEDALFAIADLVRVTVAAQRASIEVIAGDQTICVMTSPREVHGPSTSAGLALMMATEDVSAGEQEAAVLRPDRTIVRGRIGAIDAADVAIAIAIPLYVETRRVGILLIDADATPLHLDAARRRFLAAIGHYAALGAERLRLSSEAAHARALREENRAKDEVLASVSHDLRTPLTTIKLLAQSAGARGDPSAPLIEVQADHLARMVTNVLDLSRIRAGLTLDVELNTVEDLIGAAVTSAMSLRENCHILAAPDLSDPPIASRFDFVQSLRIVNNLIDNAVRYSPVGGTVTITSTREDDWVVIRVEDRGPGVPVESREHIFEPFFRASTRDSEAGHVGLGLSIATTLAELQGGRVTYEPRSGGGSIFALWLQAAESTPAAMSAEVDSDFSDFVRR